MRPLLVPARRPVRVAEAIIDQVAATGGGLGAWGRDPIDGDTGYKRAGSGNREVPYWTRERARDYSVTAYRSNPMATAVVDTYTSFCVGDSGVSWQATNPQVGEVVREFWEDPANRLGEIQELSLRSQLLLGEKLYELMVGEHSGVVRFAPIDPAHIKDIGCRSGNPLWPDLVTLPPGPESEEDRRWPLVQVDDATGLRDGKAMFWAPWRTLDTDVRGMPFLTSILDWLDSYDTVLSNLIDRTALARYMVWDVEVKGGQPEVDAFVAARGGLHVPPSGSVEVHNDSVTWKPQTVSTGAMEDTIANKSVLTNIASGTGLARTWLADPEDSNRATSQSMAEPVRRRVGGLQRVWLAQQAELVRYVVDRAVAAKRLPAMVDAKDPRTGESTQIRASQAVIVTGPEIAAADSQITAQVLLNLATGLEKLQQIGALSPEAAKTAARKAWEDYVGVPYTAELDSPEANPDDVAEVVESARRTRERHRAGGGGRDYARDGDGKFAETPGGGRPHVSGAGPAPSPTRPAVPTAEPSGGAGAGKKSTGAVIADLIEEYGNRFGQWVRISEIAKARGLNREELTRAIGELMDDDDFNAEPEPFAFRITPEDAAVAPIIGDEARHLIRWTAEAAVESARPATEQEASAREADGEQLKDYWTKGEGLAKWVSSPHPWTALRDHLAKHMSTDRADRVASQWFRSVFGYWPGERAGNNPVGPG